MPMTESRRETQDAREEQDLFDSPLQLRMAAKVISRLVERNGDCGAADEFWVDDSIESELDRDAYLDPELWDPDEDAVPEMAEIVDENIFECL